MQDLHKRISSPLFGYLFLLHIHMCCRDYQGDKPVLTTMFFFLSQASKRYCAEVWRAVDQDSRLPSGWCRGKEHTHAGAHPSSGPLAQAVELTLHLLYYMDYKRPSLIVVEQYGELEHLSLPKLAFEVPMMSLNKLCSLRKPNSSEKRDLPLGEWSGLFPKWSPLMCVGFLHCISSNEKVAGIFQRSFNNTVLDYCLLLFPSSYLQLNFSIHESIC